MLPPAPAVEPHFPKPHILILLQQAISLDVRKPANKPLHPVRFVLVTMRPMRPVAAKMRVSVQRVARSAAVKVHLNKITARLARAGQVLLLEVQCAAPQLCSVTITQSLGRICLANRKKCSNAVFCHTLCL
jgi:hypothetical protein